MMLQRITNIVVCIAALAIIGDLGYRRFFEKEVKTNNPGKRLNLVGQQITLKESSNEPGMWKLMSFVSSGCHFCRESSEQLRALELSLHAVKAPIKHILVGFEPKESLQLYAKQDGLSPEQIVSESQLSKTIQGTPTFLLVDPSGKIRIHVVGRLSKETSAQLQQNISAEIGIKIQQTL